MIILEKPYASPLMLAWIEASGHPVLENDFARDAVAQGYALRLVDDDAAAGLAASGERIYTCSENALDWVCAHAGDDLVRCIRLCKDKASMRRALAHMDPDLLFRECTMDELLALDPGELVFPLVVKPAVGFVSIGVHVVRRAEDWNAAIAELRGEMARGTVFPESVVGSGVFVIEGFITGQEYAVDLYYDSAGEPVILDVMQHDFRDASDTSDHLYYTSAALMRRAVPALTAWFRAASRELGFRDFCAHVEIRVAHAEGEDPLDAMADVANVCVIEFNPLRFAGFCGTDLGWFAYGIRTYQYYLEGLVPDWNHVESDGVTAFMAVEPPRSGRMDLTTFERDLRASCSGLEVCDLRPLDPEHQGLSVFPMVRVPAGADFAGFRRFALELDVDAYVPA